MYNQSALAHKKACHSMHSLLSACALLAGCKTEQGTDGSLEGTLCSILHSTACIVTECVAVLPHQMLSSSPLLLPQGWAAAV